MASFVKVILNNGNSSEARYIDMLSSHFVVGDLRQQVIEVFGIRPEIEFSLTYIDRDGDHITIQTNSDLYIASMQMQDHKVFHVTYLNKPTADMGDATAEENPHSVNVICDVCEKALTGYRYKCLECADYDLCNVCESAGHHSEHIFLRMPSYDMPLTRNDRNVLYNAARELKKAAHYAFKKGHRLGKDFCKGSSHKKESKFEKGAKCSSQAGPSTGGCRFAKEFNPEEFGKCASQARDHFATLFQNPSGHQANAISDIISNAIEAFFGPVQQNAQNTQTAATSKANENQPQSQENQNNGASNNNGSDKQSQPIGEKPANKEKDKLIDLTEMDWTVINNNPNIPNTSASAPTTPGNFSSAASAVNSPAPSVKSQEQEKEPQESQPPAPGFVLHSDPVIARGLAQLYEMGFSNEDDILTKLLQRFNGNVAEVVKTIFNSR